MKLRIHIFSWLFALLSLPVFSASDIYFSKIGTEQGLSQLSVMSIYQDELGAIWLATREGLNRFNGNGVEVFRPVANDSNSLGESLILSVCGDMKGHVFIHTQNGVNVYNLKTSAMRLIQKRATDGIAYGLTKLWIAESNRLYAYENDKKELYCTVSASTSAIKRILQTSDERIFLGTLSSGVFMVDKNKKIRCVLPDCSQVSDLFEDSKKNIWVCTWQKGVFKIDREGNVVNYRYNAANPQRSISSDFARSVCEENNDFLWIGTKKGLDRLNVETGEFKHYNSEGYNNNTRLSNESVWSLYKDNQGTIWVGTYFGGLNYFNPDINFYTFHNLQSGVFQNKPFPIISNIVEIDNEHLFLCSEGEGLIIYNTQTNQYKVLKAEERNPNSLSADNIKAAYYDKTTGELWLGTHLGGLCMYNSRNGRFLQFRNIKPDWPETNILSSVIPYGNNLLIGTHGGLFLFDKKLQTFSLFSEKLQNQVSYIQDVKTDDAGNVWIASFNGVYRYQPATGKTERFYNQPNDSTSLNNNNVSKIYIDTKNRIWLATSGGGVNLFLPKTNSFRHYDSKHIGLKNDYVSNLLESKFGYLIISTTKGFSMLDVENNKIYNYSSENGLPLNSLYSGGICLTSRGTVFLTGMNGMVSFNEENLSIPARPFSISLVNLWINNKLIVPNDANDILEFSLPYTSTIELNHKQTMVTLEFSSNNYIPANQPVFRYKLEGMNDSWTELPQGVTKLNFMNLGTGKYNLILEAVSPADGSVISSTSLKIRVNPPFYLAWYAWIFYIALVLFIVWRYIEFSRSRLILETSLKYEKKEKEHIEEVNQSKLRFFTNISHEFRTPLTLITGQVDMLLQMHNVPPSIYNRILNIKRNTVNMSYLINELLEFRKTEQGHLNIKASEIDLVKFLYEVYLSFSEYAGYRHIRLDFDCEPEHLKLWFDPLQMQKVFYNLISNAFKFTPKDGKIKISVTDAAEVVYVKITDSGTGIASEDMDKIFDRFYQAENGIQISNMVPGTGIGLALTKNILELHHAEITVESKQNVGSTFTVVIRKGAAHFTDDQKAEYIDADISCLNIIQEIDDNFMKEVISTQLKNNELQYSMLIVEDNDELRNMLKTIFEPIYKIYTASNGKEGLDMTIELQPDIVLSDLMMPLMSGNEMCSKIKNNFAVSHIPVVLLTAQTAVEYNLESLRLGADDYITKPFNVKTLITRCNNLVNGRKLLQEKFSHQIDTSARQIATNTMDREFIDKAVEIIEKHMENPDFDVPMFSSEMAMGRTKLFSKLKGITGQTPNDFILTIKMKKAASLLNNHPEHNISDITWMLGFNSPKYFAKCFKEQFGMSPSAFRKGDDSGEEPMEEEADAE